LKTLVVGAGGGGLSSAILAALRGEKVTLLEGHSALGGCASWFRRGPFIFDAGATTLSGLNPHEPLGELFALLGKSPKMLPADPGITFQLSNGKVIRYCKDKEKWFDELSRHFPGRNHGPFWKLIYRINELSWHLLKDVKTFPFRSLDDAFVALKHPRYISLIPFLFLSTDHALKYFDLDFPEYQELVNGILLISAQAKAQNIPFIVGAMALSYPRETYAPYGGMKGLMNFFEEELKALGVEIVKNTRVKSFSDKVVLSTDGRSFTGDRFIYNLPIWNLAELATGPLKETFESESSTRPGAWGALALYGGVESDVHELYQQIHLHHPLIDNYFVSFSIPGDSRSPQGHQAFTISTHVMAETLSEESKKAISDIIIYDFKKRFSFREIKFLTIGSPKTFERYTGRKHGFVGGLPFLYGKNPLSLLSPLTEDINIFRVGDTVFPGQGLCGVVAGSLQLHERLVKLG
jgi:phytoene dehydrogenase-like protein